MKQIKQLLGTALIALLTTTTTQAQTGNAGIGVRATPDGAGFTGKFMLADHLAFEGQLNVGGVYNLPGESFTAVALLEGVIVLPDPSWRIFFGGGLHGGVWDNGRWYNDRTDAWVGDRPEPLFGIDGIGGAEYVFKNIPLGLSADIKPAVNFTSRGPEFFDHNMFGFSARYYFR